MTARRPARFVRPLVERLEDRWAPAVLTVTTPGDVINGDTASPAALLANPGPDGIGLREAIAAANNDAAADTINFASFHAGIDNPITFAGGGALNISTDITINGLSPLSATFTVLQGPNGGPDAFPIFNITGGTVVLTDLTITGARNLDGSGGGIFNSAASLTLNNVVLSNNQARNGGGLFNTGGGVVRLVNCTISGNAATGNGGVGGGLDNIDNGTVPVMFLNGCTISGNQITGPGPTNGAGIFNTGQMAITNSTIVNNSFTLATGAGGAGIGNQIGPSPNSGVLNVLHATIVGNTDPAGLGGGVRRLGGNVAIGNSIVAGNTATGDAANNDLPPGTVNNGGGNNFTGPNPPLTPLQSNGGLTQTIAPLPGSVFINAAAPALVLDAGTGLPLTIEQRSFAGFTGIRTVGAGTDVGAVEFQPPATTTTLSVALGPVTPQGQSATLAATAAAQEPGPNNVPTGSVSFFANNVFLTTGELVNGTFTASVVLTPGAQTVAATYFGSAVFNGGTSAPRTVVAAFPVNATLAAKKGRTQLTITNGTTGLRVVQLFPFPASFLGKAGLFRLDTSNDGVQEVVVVQKSGRGNRGQVNVYDSQTGARLRTIKPFKGALRGNVKVTMLDLNGDGIIDLQLSATVQGKKVVVKLNGNGLATLP